MDPVALAGHLEAIPDRLAGSDAERRAAALCAAELRALGRRPRTGTLWFRPQRQLPRALHAAVGVAGGVVSVDHPAVGLGLTAGALVAALLDAAGVPVLALLQTRRATQNVVAAPPQERDGRVLLVVTAHADAPRTGVLGPVQRFLARRRLPGLPGILVLTLAAAAACAGARLAGATGTPLGIVQLVPSVLLIMLVGVFAEAGLARTAPSAGAAGPAAAIAVTAALDARPTAALAVEVVIAGAGEAGAAGMASYVATRRRELAPEEIVLVHLGSAPGPVRYVVSDGEHVPFRLHPRLVALAAALPGAEPLRGRERSAARVARGSRWPAIALQGETGPLAESALRLVAAVDADLARAARPPAG